jgi:hypothetical protein
VKNKETGNDMDKTVTHNSRHLHRRMRKITKNQSQISWFLGQDVNQALSNLKSKALLLEPTSSIIHISCSIYKTMCSATIILISDGGMPVVLEFSLIALTTKVVSYTTVQRVFIAKV